jgi:hypothetical protein
VAPAQGVPQALLSGAIPYNKAFNSICIPFPWSEIEGEETTYSWAGFDELVGWAEKQGLSITGGPLIDFSAVQLPSWLWLYEREVPTMASFMCKVVEATIRRYRQRIRRWQVCAGSNCARVLGLTEEELLGLTYRLADAARQLDPSLELILGVSQPWGEYLAAHDYTHSPFIFADTLIRSGINNLAALDLELVMGVSPRGSYCRDLLEVSRLLDLYALLGVPIREPTRSCAWTPAAGAAASLTRPRRSGPRRTAPWRCASRSSSRCSGCISQTSSHTSSRTLAWSMPTANSAPPSTACCASANST